MAHKEQCKRFCCAEQLLIVPYGRLSPAITVLITVLMGQSAPCPAKGTLLSSSQLYRAVELALLLRFNPFSLFLTHITFLSLIFLFFCVSLVPFASFISFHWIVHCIFIRGSLSVHEGDLCTAR